MNIYVVKLDLSQVISRLKEYKLQEFNHEFPTIFIEAPDPDEACYLTYCKFAETILRQSSHKKTAMLIDALEYDIRIMKVYIKDEKKL